MKAVPFVAVCLLAGCLARPQLDRKFFIFAPPSPPAPITAPSSRVLAIRILQVAAPFEGSAFVYRTGEFSYERDPYAAFLVPPAEGLASPIRNWWRESGEFRDVAEAGSALQPDTLVEIHVGELYGDFRQSENPAAVLGIRFVFFDATNGVPGRVILRRECSGRIPLKGRTASALMEAWNQALAQILDSTAPELERNDANPPNP
jgi:ABC-type uncharacterized transport system auxiliary subunit